MKTTARFFILIFFSISFMFSQSSERISRHAVSYHAGGTGSFFMLEYQFSPIVKKHVRFSLTAGLGYSGFVNEFPAGIEINIGNKNQLLASVQYLPMMIFDLDNVFEDDVVWRYALSPRLGYKRLIQGKYNVFFFEAYASPLFFTDDGQFLPWGGLAVGGYF